MVALQLSSLRSNWEFVAFYLIYPHVNETQRRFSMSQIIRNVEDIYQLLAIRGHERIPRTPEQTFQRTLQNMRDKNWILFLDNRGEYELTDEGYKTLLIIQPKIQYIIDNKADLLKKVEDIFKQWEIDL